MSPRSPASSFAFVAFIALASSACDGHVASGEPYTSPPPSNGPDAEGDGAATTVVLPPRIAEPGALPPSCDSGRESRVPLFFGPTLTFLRAGEQPLSLLPDQSGDVFFDEIVAVTTDRAFVTIRPSSSKDTYRLVSVRGDTGERVELDTWPTGRAATITAAVAVGDSLYYALSEQDAAGSSVAVTLRTWRAQPSPHVSVLFATDSPIRDIQARGGFIYAADAAGILRVSESGEEARRWLSTDAPIERFEVSEATVLWLEARAASFTVKRASLLALSDAHVVRTSSTPSGGPRPLDVALASDDSALVLDEGALTRFRIGGGDGDVLLASGAASFRSKLIVDGDTAIFRQDCEATGYRLPRAATRRFDLVTGRIEWLEFDVNFPFLPHIMAPNVWEARQHGSVYHAPPVTQLYVAGTPTPR